MGGHDVILPQLSSDSSLLIPKITIFVLFTIYPRPQESLRSPCRIFALTLLLFYNGNHVNFEEKTFQRCKKTSIFITSRIQRMTEGNIFSLLRGQGTPIWLMGIPYPRSGWEGTPIPGHDGRYPRPRPGQGVPPSS